jgi:predicted GIY-YIG superfamily endonuclease
MNFCYILCNDVNNSTYNGYTTDLKRRLRQHNTEIKGGAKCTTRQCAKHGVRWRYLTVVTSSDPEFTKQKALSLEWHIRYPTGRKPRPPQYNGREGRMKGLELALGHEKFRSLQFIIWKQTDLESMLTGGGGDYLSSTTTESVME